MPPPRRNRAGSLRHAAEAAGPGDQPSAPEAAATPPTHRAAARTPATAHRRRRRLAPNPSGSPSKMASMCPSALRNWAALLPARSLTVHPTGSYLSSSCVAPSAAGGPGPAGTSLFLCHPQHLATSATANHSSRGSRRPAAPPADGHRIPQPAGGAVLPRRRPAAPARRYRSPAVLRRCS